MTSKYEGNVLGLWAQLETIWEGEYYQKRIFQEKDIFIDCSSPYFDSFIENWFQKPDFRCSESACGMYCNYCKSIAKLLEKKE
mgnify:CR=1 FL=1